MIDSISLLVIYSFFIFTVIISCCTVGHKTKGELHVQDPWLFYIQNGMKKVEGRKGSKYLSWKGKVIEIYNDRTRFPVRVVETILYPDLNTYLMTEDFKNAIPTARTIEQ